MHRLARVFAAIYREALWSNGSGPGSDPENTADYRGFLETFIATHRIRTVVDLGCGDWRSSCLIDWHDVTYLGFDIVDSVIAANRRRYETETVRFRCLGDEAELPPADVLIVKDVLQHLPVEEIHALTRYLDHYAFVLVTNTVASDLRRPDGTSVRIREVNSNVKAGGMRPVDVLTAPFGWPGREVHRYECWWPKLSAWEIKSTALIRCFSRDGSKQAQFTKIFRNFPI